MSFLHFYTERLRSNDVVVTIPTVDFTRLAERAAVETASKHATLRDASPSTPLTRTTSNTSSHSSSSLSSSSSYNSSSHSSEPKTKPTRRPPSPKAKASPYRFQVGLNPKASRKLFNKDAMPPNLRQKRSMEQSEEHRAKKLKASQKVELNSEGGGLRSGIIRAAVHVSSTRWFGVNWMSGRSKVLTHENLRGMKVYMVQDPPVSLILETDEGHVLFARTTPLPRLKEGLEAVLDLLDETIKEIESDPKRAWSFPKPPSADSRGYFTAFLWGFSRATWKRASWTSLCLGHPAEWDKFMCSDEVQDLSLRMSKLVHHYFPPVFKRYQDSAPPETGLCFGIFDLFCINMAGGETVKSIPHVDWKNIALGVSVIAVYGFFDPKKRYFFCLPELGLIFEFPPFSVIILPSALLVHCNLHLADFSVVATNGEELEACPLVENRHSFVWFSQGNDIITKETGETLADARREGREQKCAYNMDIFKRE